MYLLLIKKDSFSVNQIYTASRVKDESQKTHAILLIVIFSILQTLLDNEFLSDAFKRSVQEAGQLGHAHPGSCARFACTNQEERYLGEKSGLAP